MKQLMRCKSCGNQFYQSRKVRECPNCGHKNLVLLKTVIAGNPKANRGSVKTVPAKNYELYPLTYLADSLGIEHDEILKRLRENPDEVENQLKGLTL